MSAQELVEAYVLFQRPYRESSVIADFVTAEDQHIRAVCKGVGGSSRQALRSRSALQPFAPLGISVSGNSELKSLRQVESLAAPLPLAGQMLYSALYVNELTVRLCRTEGVAPGLFQSYNAALKKLSQLPDVQTQSQGAGSIDQQQREGRPLEAILRGFEFALLRICGYDIDAAQDARDGSAIRANINYRFDPLHGFFPVDESIRGSASGSVSLSDIPGTILLAIARRQFEQRSVQHYAKLIVREALGPLLGSKPLKSRELFVQSASD